MLEQIIPSGLNTATFSFFKISKMFLVLMKKHSKQFFSFDTKQQMRNQLTAPLRPTVTDVTAIFNTAEK